APNTASGTPKNAGISAVQLTMLVPKYPIKPSAIRIAPAAIVIFATDSHSRKEVRLEGFEPPTYGSVGRCSIQLSYRRLGLLGHDSHKYFRSIGMAAKAVNFPRSLPALAKGLGILQDSERRGRIRLKSNR